jgi:hypothetical protein
MFSGFFSTISDKEVTQLKQTTKAESTNAALTSPSPPEHHAGTLSSPL